LRGDGDQVYGNPSWTGCLSSRNRT
jgi:hypothetical protein